MSTICPFCRNEVIEDKDVPNNNYARCKKCELPFHRECYELSQLDGKCMRFACDGEISYEPVKSELTEIVVRNDNSLAVPTKEIAAHMRVLEELVREFDELCGLPPDKIQQSIRKVCGNAYPLEVIEIYESYLWGHNNLHVNYVKKKYNLNDCFVSCEEPLFPSKSKDYFCMGAIGGFVLALLAFPFGIGYLGSMIAGGAIGFGYSKYTENASWESSQKQKIQQEKLEDAYRKQIADRNKRYQKRFQVMLENKK